MRAQGADPWSGDWNDTGRTKNTYNKKLKGGAEKYYYDGGFNGQCGHCGCVGYKCVNCPKKKNWPPEPWWQKPGDPNADEKIRVRSENSIHVKKAGDNFDKYRWPIWADDDDGDDKETKWPDWSEETKSKLYDRDEWRKRMFGPDAVGKGDAEKRANRIKEKKSVKIDGRPPTTHTFKSTRRRCLNGHKLERIKLKEIGWTRTLCFRGMAIGRILYGCDECNYDDFTTCHHMRTDEVALKRR